MKIRRINPENKGLRINADSGLGDVVQTGQAWNDVIAPKALGAVNLDLESRKLPQALDVFVMFSSGIVETGNPG